MADQKDGGPAFPRDNGKIGGTEGMSLRDWFAGQALAGLMADPGLRPTSLNEVQHMAKRLYQMADAMLAARESDVTPPEGEPK